MDSFSVSGTTGEQPTACDGGARSAPLPPRGGPDGDSTVSDEPEYQSRLADWYEVASVRSKPHQILDVTEIQNGKVFFSPEQVKIADHFLVGQKGRPDSRRFLEIQHFFNYMRFTEYLEHKAVNRVTQLIALGRTGVRLPAMTRHDGHKIYVDEAYHALFSDDMVMQVQAATGVNPSSVQPPLFLNALAKAIRSMPPDLQPLGLFGFVTVSETLISGTLSKLPKDGRVVTAIRELVADHAMDEATHHAYFSDFFARLWRQLTKKEQEILGVKLPSFITMFLRQDRRWWTAALRDCGLSAAEAEQVFAETYPVAASGQAARPLAGATLRLFERVGVFNNITIKDAFQAADLL